MKHIKTFEQFEVSDTDSLNEEIKLFGKDIKLRPTFNDLKKWKLAFLNDIDLNELTPGGNQSEIKNIAKQVNKILNKTGWEVLDEKIDKCTVHQLKSLLDALKKMKAALNDEDALVGGITFYDELDKFLYTEGLFILKDRVLF